MLFVKKEKVQVLAPSTFVDSKIANPLIILLQSCWKILQL